MEGVHFVAGPWFTVLESSNDWNEIATLDLGDGQRTVPARVEMKLRLSEGIANP